MEIDSKVLNKKELESYYRQEPNRKFLRIFSFRLGAYNFAQFGKQRKWKSWIERVIGEEPSVYDSVLVQQTSEQFSKFLKNEAFYDAKVSHEVVHKRKRAWVTYTIETNKPVTINQVTYQINDSSLLDIVYSDTVDNALEFGERMTVESLEKERGRLVLQMRDSGYFNFNNNYIRYQVDTLSHKANITLILDQVTIQDSLQNISRESHKKYWINDVYFIPDFDPQLAIKNRQNYFNTFDTSYYDGFGFIYSDEINIKPKVILKANTIFSGDKYNFSKVNSTTRYLNSLKLFRLNNLGFYTEKSNDSLINCVVQLTPSVYQNYSVNFETTHTQGNFGVGGYVNYEHKNLFKGAEIFNFKVSGSLQRQPKTETAPAFNIYEYGAESTLETPSFVLPFKMERFYKRYNPKTNFLASYNYQLRPDYKRTYSNTSMGYDWKGSPTITHYLNPIDIGFVDVTFLSEQYEDSIKGTYLENNFKDYLIIGGNYSLIYQNKAKNAYKSYSYYRFNVGVAGNLLHFLHDDIGLKEIDDEGYYTIFGLQYAQYVLSNFDYRYNYFLNKNNSLVSRAFAGFAYPYGNSNGIPFIKQYYAGGAQGIRAWQPRDLGPGTYVVDSATRNSGDYYPNQLGDIKLEFNLEYRYSINESWKGAVFVDVGNIWLHKLDSNRIGGEFNIETFYKQLAVGTGFGIRYDLDFAVFRMDWGIKVRDPAIQGNEWVLFHKAFNIKDDMIWHFAVGYPF